MIRADELGRMDLRQLEDLYAAPTPLPPLRGRFRGRFLCRLHSRAAGTRTWSLATTLFQRVPFGIDFDRSEWFFLVPAVGVGRFTAARAMSRWRDTETFALDYGASALPRPVRGLLYDEVKPLADDLCLGMGGMNAPRGEGELFFFLLERI